MPGFFEGLSDEISPIVLAALEEVREFTRSGGHENLLRRFQRQYGTLSLEDISEISSALGHQDEEEKPCRVCQIMATKEVQLSQEE